METQPALLAVWRRINGRIVNRPLSVNWLAEHIERVLPVSLRLATDLLYYFGNDRSHILPQGSWPIVRRRMLDAAKPAFVDAQALLRAIADGSDRMRYALLHFVRPPDHRNDPIDIRPHDRAWLAPLFVEAARRQPTLVISNVLHMFGDSDNWWELEGDVERRLQKAYQLRRDQAQAILGDHVVEMLEIVSAYEPSDDAGRSAMMQAEAWLTEIRTALATRLVVLLSAEVGRQQRESPINSP
jgi:hypothetical protein